MYSLFDTINWASAFVQFQPLNAGLNFEPALSIGNMIRDTLLYANVWPWNRKEVTETVTANTQDYTFLLTDFGFLEKATLTDATGESYELQDILNQSPVAAGNTAPGRPTAISIIDFIPATSITVRLMGIPQETFTLTLTYQKLVTEFVYAPVTQVIASAPGGSALDQTGQGSDSSGSATNFFIPASPLTNTVTGEWGVAILEGPSATIDPSWTTLSTTSLQTKYFAASTSAQLTGSFGGGPATYCGCIATFFVTAGAPTITNFWETGFGFSVAPRTFVSVIPGAVTTGHTILVTITLLGPTGGVTTVTDNMGNVYTMISSSTATSRGAQLWMATNVTGGALQVTVSNTAGFASSGTIGAFDVPGLASGPTQYIGTFDPTDFPTSTEVEISGFVNPTNNGLFTILSSDGTHLFVTNTSAINETTANGVAVLGDWTPIPENYKDIYNNLFLAETFALVDDERSKAYRLRGMAALFGRLGGLSETEKNIFTQRVLAAMSARVSTQKLVTQGVQGRGQ